MVWENIVGLACDIHHRGHSRVSHIHLHSDHRGSLDKDRKDRMVHRDHKGMDQ